MCCCNLDVSGFKDHPFFKDLFDGSLDLDPGLHGCYWIAEYHKRQALLVKTLLEEKGDCPFKLVISKSNCAYVAYPDKETNHLYPPDYYTCGFGSCAFDTELFYVAHCGGLTER